MDKPVFLIHGFRSDSAAMNDLAKVLKSDFMPVLVELPLSFESLESALLQLKQILTKYLIQNRWEELYFVGHSTGGIIIRMLMKDRNFASITKACLFIATPNNGTELAEIHQTLPPLIKEIHEPIKYLTKKAIAKLQLIKPNNVIYGGIAGSDNMALTDFLFNSENDGIVTVKSVFIKGMNDFIVLPYNHIEIMHYASTCIFIKYFLQNGIFPNKIKDIIKMTINEKFITIVSNGYINELCAQFKNNINFATAGGKVWWNNIATLNGWKLQQNKITKHFRILNPDNIRKAWGVSQSIIEAIDFIYERIKIEEVANNLSFDKTDNSSKDDIDKIREWAKLRDEGLISNNEFENKKREILNKK
jgi:hypothetical protein